MVTYRELEAKLDNEVADYKFEMVRRLGPPGPYDRWSGAAPRAGRKHTTDTPETDLESCSRCGELTEAINLGPLDLCPPCYEQTEDEHCQEMETNREDYS